LDREDLIYPIEVPEDFESFWHEVVANALAVPLYFRRSKAVGIQSENGHSLDLIEFHGAGGQPLEGWIAYPEHGKRLPGFVWVPPYGRESLLPNQYGTREGIPSMSLNLHGLGAFHQEKYTPSRGYFGEGALEPETWIFRSLIQHVLIAVRVFQAQPEVDEDRIGIMGMSQGAGLSLWASTLSPIIKAVVADMPFLGGMSVTLGRSAYRYPLKELADLMDSVPLGRERVLHTLTYYDTLHHATRVTKPAQVSLGEKDPACRPDMVRSIYAAIPSEQKRIIEYPGGHDWDPLMLPNNLSWLLQHL
jgi:cephalosporin-C deacetylase